MKLIILLIISIIKFTYSAPLSNNDLLTIRIVHTNDMHARFEETNKLSVPVCSEKEKEDNNCYGGFSRIATLVRKAKKQTKIPTFFLNAGDTYQGSPIFTEFKYKVVADLLNILSPDAVSLGNHEFDDGVDGLIPFINKINFPIVTANLNLDKEPGLKATKLQNYTILEANGRKIGVIGYLTPDTKFLASTREVVFMDEVETIREVSKKLKQDGIDIIIALGHSGFDMDKKIAAEVEDVDLVIGGHTNTFLYTGEKPDREEPEGLYPVEIIQPKTKRKVYVVQAYAYTKYLGNLTLTFDRDGEITEIIGNPILVDSSIPQAEDVLQEVEKYAVVVRQKYGTVIGKTRVLLSGEGKICRIEECNFGNLAADAMIDYNVLHYFNRTGWTDAPVALLNGGGIRSSIERSNNDKITLADMVAAFPFSSQLYELVVSGETLLQVMEHSIYDRKSLDSTEHGGGFLQVSGIKVTYDTSREKLSRVVDLKIRCGYCDIPEYKDFKISNNYTILIPDYMYNGGDGYYMFKGLAYKNLNVTVEKVVQLYINRTTPVYPEVEGRITVLDGSIAGNRNSENSANSFNISWIINAICVTIIALFRHRFY